MPGRRKISMKLGKGKSGRAVLSGETPVKSIIKPRPGSGCYELFVNSLQKSTRLTREIIQLYSTRVTDEIEVTACPEPDCERYVYVYSVPPTFHRLVGDKLNLFTPVCVDLEHKVYTVFEPLFLVFRISEETGSDVTVSDVLDAVNYAHALIVGYAEKLEMGKGSIYELLSSIARTAIEVVNEELKKLPYNHIVMYYILRRLIGYDVLDPILSDRWHVEDLVISGPNVEPKVSVRILDRVYQLTVPLRLEEYELNSLIERLVMLTGGTVTMLSPLASRMLPHQHRLTVSYGREVSVNGPVLVVRMFPEPWNILRLLRVKGIHPLMAAAVGSAIILRKSFIVAGVMGSGKTSLMNSLLSFIPKDRTVVTIEDTPELVLPHCYWIRHVTREAIGEERGSITMFDLMKHALRESADYVIIGEVRGAEGRIWAQAIATGHGGLTTFHAESAYTVLARLKAEPINVEASLLSALHGIVMMRKDLETGRRIAREYYDVVTRVDDKTGSVINEPVRFMVLERIHDESRVSGECTGEAERREIRSSFELRISIGEDGLSVGETIVVRDSNGISLCLPSLSRDESSYMYIKVGPKDASTIREVYMSNAKIVKSYLEALGRSDSRVHLLNVLREEGDLERYLDYFLRLSRALGAINLLLTLLSTDVRTLASIKRHLNYEVAAVLVWDVMDSQHNVEKLEKMVYDGLEASARENQVDTRSLAIIFEEYVTDLMQKYEERWLCKQEVFR